MKLPSAAIAAVIGVVAIATLAAAQAGPTTDMSRVAPGAPVQVGGTSSAHFSAVPTSGPAPLAVTFSAPEADKNYSVDLGGAEGERDFDLVCAAAPAAGRPCRQSVAKTMTHTYSRPGAYTAHLKKVTGHVPSPNQSGPVQILRTVVATITITVTPAGSGSR
jgi:PKD repeat protein